jgi:hypothetical protein
MQQLDSVAYDVEVDFRSWEEEFDQTVHLFRVCLDTLNTLHMIQLVSSSKMLVVSTSFPDWGDKLRLVQTFHLERQLRLLRTKLQNLKEQQNKLFVFIRKNLKMFFPETTRCENETPRPAAYDQVAPLEFVTYLEYISRLVRSQTSQLEELCLHSCLFTYQDTVDTRDCQELEKFLEQSSFERSEVNEWFVKIQRIREGREAFKSFAQ